MASSKPVVSPLDEYNQTLINNAHPPEWINPKPQGRYNLVVVGGGTAGLVAAAGAAGLGARVALIERHLLGGDCLVSGCVPSKALIRASRAAYEPMHSAEFGVHLPPSNPPRLEFGDAMQRMRRLRSQISFHDSAQRFAKLGVDVFLGQAAFISKNMIDVEGARLEFARAILANGARAAVLPVAGLEDAGYLTNESVFSLTRCPASLIVIGAGPIGCELAQAFRRFGAEVSVVSIDPQILPREDADAAALLQQQLEREGVRLFLGARVRLAEKSSVGKTIVFERGQGVEHVTADEILVAAGRSPNIEGLNLEAAGVQYHAKGVSVDDHLRTTNPRIYAAGDICSSYQFTHAAEALARIALQNALFFGRKKASDLVIPWCTYTDPEIAHVGLSSSEAQKLGPRVGTITLQLDSNDRAIVDGESDGFLRVHFNSEKGAVLGATLISKHAGESIGELVLAIQKKMKVWELGSIIHPYPTQAEIIKRLGDAALRTRLKPWMKKLLQKILSLRR
ncbi:MAG TPA: mercuric reductase [Candidatus Angelobacter sp.]|jgi:pyruvate/2-oxoglutarate dehydrogenase complex dihydrolipoamide dehydrogenase (E3) component|nr:mercuric reductase [Candidatus Angelobacter sp.]